MLRKIFFFILLIANLNLGANEKSFRPKLTLEYGRFKIIKNLIQFGEEGSKFDFIKEGGQENLYPHMRFYIETPLNSQKLFLKILYQSFFIETFSRLRRNISLDDKVIEEEKAIDCQYNFPFTRLSLLYTWLHNHQTVRFGPSLQIRNASIIITTADGNTRVGRLGTGLVGLFSLVHEYKFESLRLKTELDGLGQIKEKDRGGYLYEFSFSILKKQHKDYDLLSGLRYFTGGYAGQNSSTSALQGNYTKNYVESLSFFLGLSYKV